MEFHQSSFTACFSKLHPPGAIPCWLGWDVSPLHPISCPCPRSRSRNRTAAQFLPASAQFRLVSALHLRAGNKPRISWDLSVCQVTSLQVKAVSSAVRGNTMGPSPSTQGFTAFLNGPPLIPGGSARLDWELVQAGLASLRSALTSSSENLSSELLVSNKF